jgi:hypothetical protein
MSVSSLIAHHYELGDLVGQGGMGAVYLGRDTQTGDTVAIKLLKPKLVAAPDAVARFAREGAALRALAHPNIVAVLATTSVGDQHAIVMEYVPGGSLADRAGMADALGGLGDVATAQAAYGQARRYYQESLGLRQALGNKVGIAACLEGLAALALAQGALQYAARLLSAATALRDALGAPLSPIDRPRYETVLEHTRAQLGEAAFAVAWDAGRALPLEQTIAEALNAGG